MSEAVLFIKTLTNGTINLSSNNGETLKGPEIEIFVDLELEEKEQKSADSGHSLWKLDPEYVAQVFVSLEMLPEGIEGEYPIKEKDISVVQNNGEEAIIEISGDETPIKAVYLKCFIRQDATGIWSVVGYDPIN